MLSAQSLQLVFLVGYLTVQTSMSAVKTSKACFGNHGLSCTEHTLECSSGMIAIQDAYYTNSTACPDVGLSNCNINVSSIPDTGRYQGFNETQLNNLYKNCSYQQSCTFIGGRKSASINFSIVTYICINVDTSHQTVYVPTTSAVLPTSTTPGSGTTITSLSQNNTQRNQDASNTGTVLGVVIPCLFIIVAIVLIAVFVFRRKKAKTAKKDDKTNPNTKEYSLARDVHQNEYFEIEKKMPAKMAKTDYDNAGFVKTTGNARSKDHEVYSLAGVAHSNEYFEIEPTAPKNSLMAYDYAEVSNTHASTSQNEENVGQTNIQVQEDDYDHVGGKPMIQNGHYNTTASVANTLSKLKLSDKNGDVYSYDHIDGKSSTDNANNDYNIADRSSDYDTTASVQKRFDHATECREDDYGYNHLGNQVQKKTLHNDYDTSASAVTAVARLNSRTDDPDYDHVTKDTGVDLVPSSCDIPENNEDDSDAYTLAGKGDNPYQLAK